MSTRNWKYQTSFFAEDCHDRLSANAGHIGFRPCGALLAMTAKTSASPYVTE